MSIDTATAAKVAKLARICGARGRSACPRARAERDHRVHGAAERGGCDRGGADGVGDADAAETAGGCGDGRRHGRGRAEERAGRARGVLCGAEGGGMTLNSLTIAAARDALRKGEASAVDLTMACMTAMDAGDGLNAFVHRTPEIALDQARAADARLTKGRCARDVRHSAGHQGFVLHQGRAEPGRVEHPEGVPARIRIHRHEPAVRRGRGDAGQAEHGRVRHGLVERDLVLRQCGQPVAARQRRHGADARRVVGRVGIRRRRRPVPCRDRHRHRRVDPPARGLHRDRRHQADLWPGQPLGDRGLCLVAGSGGADDEDGARCGDHAGGDGGA